MSRKLLYAAAAVVFITALVIGLTLPSKPTSECIRTDDSGGSLFDALDMCAEYRVDSRVPLRVGIIGGGAVGALVLGALAARQRLEQRTASSTN